MGKARESVGAARNHFPQTIQWDEKEFEIITEGAKATGLYNHGFVKAVARIAFGLPVNQIIQKAVEEFLDEYT